MHDTTPKITVILVDEDQSAASQQLVQGLEREASLTVLLRPTSKEKTAQPEYNAATAEAAVKAGDAPVALIIPKGFGLQSRRLWSLSKTQPRSNCSTTRAT